MGRVEIFRIEDLQFARAVDHEQSAVLGDGPRPGLAGQGGHLAGQQALAVVLADEDREIGEVAQKFRIVEPAVDDDPGHAEGQGGVGIGLDRQPLVGLGGGAAEVGIDHHHPAAALGLDQVMGVGQSGLDDVGAEDHGGAGVDPFQRFEFLALHPEGHRPEHRQVAVLVVAVVHGPVGEAGQGHHRPLLDIAGAGDLDGRGDRLRAVFVADLLEFAGRVVEGLRPAGPAELAAAAGAGADQRVLQAVLAVDQVGHRQAAQTAARVVRFLRIVGRLDQGADPALGDPGLEAAGPGAVRRTGGADQLLDLRRMGLGIIGKMEKPQAECQGAAGTDSPP